MTVVWPNGKTSRGFYGETIWRDMVRVYSRRDRCCGGWAVRLGWLRRRVIGASANG